MLSRAPQPDAPTLDAFMCRLAARPPSPTVANQYGGAVGDLRLLNLRRYLEHVLAIGPSAVVVGEAPGYRGSAVTGVPLTTRALLASDLGRWDLFSACHFQTGDALGAPAAEITATVVWRAAVQHLAQPPLTWNAFPFHPHPPATAGANRPPTATDLAEGAGYLRALLALAPCTPVIAMGRQAARALAAIGVDAIACLRHPAHGGAAQFTAGFAAAACHLPA